MNWRVLTMSDELKLLLDEWKATAAAATPGPWARHLFGLGGDPEPTSIVVHTGGFDWTDLASEDSESAVAWMPCADSQPDDDAAFIALSRTLVPRLIAAVEAVLGEHRPGDGASQGFTVHGYGWVEPYCDGCVASDEYAVEYPCYTVTAIHNALIGGHDD